MERVPEIGGMDNLSEIESYEILSKKYLGLVEERFVKRANHLFKKNNYTKRPVILDVGVGPAHIPVRFALEEPTARFIAVDISLNMLKKAKLKIAEEKLEKKILFVCADANNLPFMKNTFDFVYSHSTLHHLSNPYPAIQEMIRVLRNNSSFIIRDIRRPPSFLLEMYVRVFGFPYNKLMKKMYRESLKAGYTFEEMKQISKNIKLAESKARKFFITHVGIEGKIFEHC